MPTNGKSGSVSVSVRKVLPTTAGGPGREKSVCLVNKVTFDLYVWYVGSP